MNVVDVLDAGSAGTVVVFLGFPHCQLLPVSSILMQLQTARATSLVNVGWNSALSPSRIKFILVNIFICMHHFAAIVVAGSMVLNMYVGLRIVTSGNISLTLYSPSHLVLSLILWEFGSAPAAEI